MQGVGDNGLLVLDGPTIEVVAEFEDCVVGSFGISLGGGFGLPVSGSESNETGAGESQGRGTHTSPQAAATNGRTSSEP